MNHLKWMGHSATIFDIQKSLKSDHQTCDVTLACKGKSVRAHRFVLSSCSDLLRDLLSDVPVGDEATVIVPDIKGLLLDSVLSFIYLGETSLTSSNLSDFLETINVLGIKSAISFECANNNTITNTSTSNKNLTEIPEIEDDFMETDVQQEIISKEDEEEETVVEQPGVQDLEFLEVYNEPQKITYSIEHINSNPPSGNEFILTENSGTFTLTQNTKMEENITMSSTTNSKHEVDSEESGQLIEDYTPVPIIKNFDNLNDSATELVEPSDENTAAGDSDEYKTYQHFNDTQSQRNENLDNAVSAVVDGGISLQKAAQKFAISKTVLWRRVKKHPLYMKTHRENPIIASACERLKTGDSLKSISQALDIPMSTLHRHKVRLAQEGRLPDYVTFKKRCPLSKEVLKDKLSKAVQACLNNGMSQNHAANLFEVPKSTLWRHLQKRIATADQDNVDNIKEEVILS